MWARPAPCARATRQWRRARTRVPLARWRLAAAIVAVGFLMPVIAAAQVFDVEDTLEESIIRTVPLLTLRPIQWVRDRWHVTRDYLHSRLRLDLGVSYTLIAQQAAELGSPDDAIVGSLDMYGIWTLLDRPRLGRGAIGVLARDRRNWGALTADDLSTRIGLPWAVNDSASGSYTRINQLWWRHEIVGGKVTVQLGRVDQTSFFGRNHAAGSGNTQFMMQSFVNDQTVRYPGNGTGMSVRWEPDERVYLTAGFGDANGDPNKPPDDDLGLFTKGDYFRALELGISPDMTRLWSRFRRGTYRVLGWNSDGTKDNPAGSGFALSFDQEVETHLVPFVRYGHSPDGAFRAVHALSLGVLWERPFGRGSDRAGVAATWADPAGDGGRDQYATEVFYRLELIEGLAVTPDLQFVFQPAERPQRDVVTVVGVRTRLVF